MTHKFPQHQQRLLHKFCLIHNKKHTLNMKIRKFSSSSLNYANNHRFKMLQQIIGYNNYQTSVI